MKPSISLAKLQQLLESKNELLILNVRSQQEYEANHIPLALSIPIESLEAGGFVPEPGKIIVTVCGKGGGRSERAAHYLRNNFSNEVYFLEGGTAVWLS